MISTLISIGSMLGRVVVGIEHLDRVVTSTCVARVQRVGLLPETGAIARLQGVGF